jgi:hypothetical protein
MAVLGRTAKGVATKEFPMFNCSACNVILDAPYFVRDLMGKDFPVCGYCKADHDKDVRESNFLALDFPGEMLSWDEHSIFIQLTAKYEYAPLEARRIRRQF